MKNEEELRAHLAKYPRPKLVATTTLKPGYVACIEPVPTIFGAEVHCGDEDRQDVLRIIDGG